MCPEPMGARENLKLDSVQFTISAFGFEVRESSNFKFSSPDSRLDFHEQLLVLAVFFVEYDCTLRCLQSIGKLADFHISRAETRPAGGVERICFNGAFQDVGSVFRRSAIEK